MILDPRIIRTCCVMHLRRPGSVVGNGPGIKSRWVARFSAPVQTCPGDQPASCTMGTGSFLGVKSGRGVMLTPHPLLVPRSGKRRAIPLFPYWPYGLYRASVLVQYSYTSTPPMDCMACRVQLYLYSPYWLYGLYRASVPI